MGGKWGHSSYRESETNLSQNEKMLYGILEDRDVDSQHGRPLTVFCGLCRFCGNLDEIPLVRIPEGNGEGKWGHSSYRESETNLSQNEKMLYGILEDRDVDSQHGRPLTVLCGLCRFYGNLDEIPLVRIPGMA
jgi:exonuclease VII small subunit